MIRLLISTVAAAVILFLWGYIAWGLLPLHHTSGGEFKDEAVVASTLMEQTPVSGTYWIPAMPDPGDAEATAAWTERHKAGPRALVFVNREGSEPMDPMLFVSGFAINLVTGLVLSAGLFMARRAPGGYVGRVLFVVGVGFIVGLEADMKAMNWLYVPMDWTMANVLDHLIGFGACGLVMAAIIKPPAPVLEETP